MPLKPHIPFILIFCLYSFSAIGQAPPVESTITKNSKTSLKLSIGYLQPLGEFAELANNDFTSYNLNTQWQINIAGEATSGFYTSLSMEYRLHKNFGVGIHTDYSSTNTSDPLFRDLFDLDTTSTLTEASSSGNWKTASAMVTVSYSVTVNKWNVGVELMAGEQLALSPDVTLYRLNPEIGTFNGVDSFHLKYEQSTRKDFSPAYGMALNLNYLIRKKMTIILTGLYQYSKHTFDEGNPFDYTASITTPQGVTTTSKRNIEYTFSKKIEFYTVSLGVAYAL